MAQTHPWRSPQVPLKMGGDDAMCKVFVKGFPKNCTETELSTYLQKFGGLVSFKLTTDKKGKSRGFGFGEYKNKKVMVVKCMVSCLSNLYIL